MTQGAMCVFLLKSLACTFRARQTIPQGSRGGRTYSRYRGTVVAVKSRGKFPLEKFKRAWPSRFDLKKKDPRK